MISSTLNHSLRNESCSLTDLLLWLAFYHFILDYVSSWHSLLRNGSDTWIESYWELFICCTIFDAVTICKTLLCSQMCIMYITLLIIIYYLCDLRSILPNASICSMLAIYSRRILVRIVRLLCDRALCYEFQMFC